MQSRKTDTGLNPPLIYCIAPASLASNSTSEREQVLSSLLSRVAAMQFNALLLTDVVSFCASAADATDSENSVATSTANVDVVAALATACRQQGLRLLLDLEVDRFAQNDDVVANNPEHFFDHIGNAVELPDPRFTRAVQHDRRAQLRLDAPGLALAQTYWQTRLQSWLAAGVGGFRCLGIARIAPSLWQTLIGHTRQQHPDAAFLAWTPGCTPEQLHAIDDCGFDGVFSSDAWWDYRANWFAEEHNRLAPIARIIATPEDPIGPRLLRSLHAEEAGLAQRGYRRALQSAIANGDGLMIVQGFEYGSDVALSDVDCDPRWAEQPLFDLSSDIADANRHAISANYTLQATVTPLSAPHADIALLLKPQSTDAGKQSVALVTAVNADLHQPHALTGCTLHERAGGWTIDLGGQQSITLQAGEVRVLQARIDKPVVSPVSGGKPAVVRAARTPRIAIESVTPMVDAGRFPAKKIVGTAIEIEADIFSDGHDHLAASVLWRAADEKDWHDVPMEPTVNDRWRATLPLQRIGRHIFTVEAWRDNFDTYRDELDKKNNAGLDVTLEIQEGRQLIEKVIAGQTEDSVDTDNLRRLLKQLPAKPKKKAAAPVDNKDAITLLLSAETAQLMRRTDLRDFSTRSIEYKIDVERKRTEFSNWYELFPRSQSGDVHRHGTFDDVIARMPAVRDMGFDTLYFPPIHPIGRKNMKGKNNTLTPGPDDPGSPYAIGSAAGGHDAVHPELGTLDDFRRLVAEAKNHGLEIALDFAIQCSPDHPWLQQHPEWFAYRPDGSIRYAENPPKKYEDIVNVDFYAESENGSAIPDLWIALRDVVLMWVREGVRTFRVDNPHTKPLPFWEWMIGDIRARAPDTIFLAEAFTRPKPMYRLAKVGFSQSYTYFTWRHTKQEFIDYLTELTATQPAGGPREFFRPHFFVNTPDINPYFLQRSGRAGFVIRAALAATLSGLWGVYSGFELCEAQAVTGKEEYLDSEKYEIRAWDWNRPGNIVREVTLLNRIRNANPALHTHLNVQFHPSSSDQILYFSKSTRGSKNEDDVDMFGDNVLLIAINLDPFNAHEATIDLPLWQFGLPDHGSVEVEELISESRFTWTGRQQHVRLDPQHMPFAIWRIRPAQ